MTAAPGSVSEIPGAAAAIRAVRRAGWSVAVGTGGWRASALFKLATAGIDASSIPAAFAEDHVSREGIVVAARARADSAAGRSASRVVYVGDAVWDVRACRALGLPLVGIGVGSHRERLLAADAGAALADLADTDAVLDALDRAAVPAG